MKLAFTALFALSIATMASSAQAHPSSVQTALLAACDKTLLFKVSIVSPDLITEKYYVEDSDGEIFDVKKLEFEDATTFRFEVDGVEHTIVRTFEWNGMDGKFLYRRNGTQCATWIVQPH